MPRIKINHPQGFVADGPQRYDRAARLLHLAGIQAAVLAEYHERLDTAGAVRRWLLRRRVRAEVQRRLAAAMAQADLPEPSPYALW